MPNEKPIIETLEWWRPDQKLPEHRRYCIVKPEEKIEVVTFREYEEVFESVKDYQKWYLEDITLWAYMPNGERLNITYWI